MTPKLIQLARYVKAVLDERDKRDVEVRAVAFCSLNRRVPQLLADPRVDLTTAPRPWGVPKWVMPLVVLAPTLGGPDPIPPEQMLESFSAQRIFGRAR